MGDINVNLAFLGTNNIQHSLKHSDLFPSVYAPGTCGDQCIIAGIYCGTSALACAHDAKVEEAKKKEKNNEKKKMPNQEIVRQTYRKYLF